jgi:hypothetical protein
VARIQKQSSDGVFNGVTHCRHAVVS